MLPIVKRKKRKFEELLCASAHQPGTARSVDATDRHGYGVSVQRRARVRAATGLFGDQSAGLASLLVSLTAGAPQVDCDAVSPDMPQQGVTAETFHRAVGQN